MTDPKHFDRADAPEADAHSASNQDLDAIFDDIGEADLDELFANLPSPDLTQAQKERQAMRAAAKAIAQWLPKRRVLYVTRARCRSCGATHDLPSSHLLTEFQHSKDGTRKWAKADPLSAHLSIEVEYLEGHQCDICQHCVPGE